jgi:hypothetical protein
MMTIHAPAVLPAHERLRIAGAVLRATSVPGMPALTRAFLDAWRAYVEIEKDREAAALAFDTGAADQHAAPSRGEAGRICVNLDLARGDLLAALRLSLLNDGLVPIDVLNDGERHVVEFALRSDPLRPAWAVGVEAIAAGGDPGWAAADEEAEVIGI